MTSTNSPGRGPFAGTRVAVTGAGRGIGRAVAARFAAEGADVAVIDRDGAAAQKVSAELPRSSAYRLDIADSAAVENFFGSAPEPFEVVVANAGVGSARAEVVEIRDADWARVIDVNLTGTFHTIRSAAARMQSAGLAGRIVVTASIAGLTAEAGGAAYCASKWGVIGLLKSAALELAPHGIRVNGVCPGDVDTPLLYGFGLSDEDVYHGPLARMADVEEIAGAYLWLASPEARYVVGETIVIDGGLSISALAH